MSDPGGPYTVCEDPLATHTSVILDGTGSFSSFFPVEEYQWEVSEGTLVDAGSPEPELLLPVTGMVRTVTVTLTVVNERGFSSTAAETTIDVFQETWPGYPDVPGPAMGNHLRLSKEATGEIRFSWLQEFPGETGGYEIVGLDSASGPPSAGAMDQAPIIAGPVEEGVTERVVDTPAGELSFYKIRWISRCGSRTGPTAPNP